MSDTDDDMAAGAQEYEAWLEDGEEGVRCRYCRESYLQWVRDSATKRWSLVDQ